MAAESGSTNVPSAIAGPSAASIASKYKVVFLGDAFVGKTCLINKFIYDTFDSNYQVTIGIDFVSKTMYVEDKTVKLQLWDTAGQERFRSLMPNYIRDAAVIVTVYDVGSMSRAFLATVDKVSFNNVPQWVRDAKETRGNDVKIVLVGNKTDVEDKRQVTAEEGSKLAGELGVQFFETSAKTGANVKLMFQKVASLLPGLEGAEITSDADGMCQQRGESVGGVNLQVSATTQPKKKGCCGGN